MLRRAALAMLGLILLALSGGCQEASRRGPPGERFSPMALSEAPAELRQWYDQMKAVPGLYVMNRGEETFLLLVAGWTEMGQQLELVAVQPGPGADELRVLAVLRGDGSSAKYPYLLLRAEERLASRYRARVSTPSGDVLELYAMRVESP
jgi:hypothetical protein